MTYSTFVKQTLMDSIHELSQTPENYAVHPDTDFTRNRKIGFKDFLLLLLTMEDDCLREELYRFFLSYRRCANKGCLLSSACETQR